MGAYERFTPVIKREEFTSIEIAFIENIAGLSYQAGDLLYYDGANLTVLHKGSNGQILTLVAGLPAWSSESGLGTVTTVSVSASDGIVGSVATDSTTPVISLSLGDITPDSVTSAGVVKPSANDGAALGASGTAWADLFLASGAVIDFGAGDVTVTHSSGVLTFSDGITVTGAVLPAVDNPPALGASGQAWSDLYLGSGGIINFNAGDVTITHAANTLSIAGASSGINLNNLTVVTNTTDNASVQVAIFQGDRATMADDDEAYLTFRLSNDAGSQTEVARLTWVATDVNAGTSVDGRLDFAVMTAGTLADELQLDGASLSPSASDGLTLGTSSFMWSDLFLASGAVISFNAGDMTITHAANSLRFAGGIVGFSEAAPTAVTGFERVVFEDADGGLSDWSFRVAGGGFGAMNFAASLGTLASPATLTSNDVIGYIGALGHDGTNYIEAARISFVTDPDSTPGTNDMPGMIVFSVTADAASSITDRVAIGADGALRPASDNGVSLGNTNYRWADLFLFAGGVINFSSGDVTITHNTNVLVFEGASSGYKFDAAVLPNASDGAALGSAALMWSDLFLASGAVVNFNAGNLTLTHSAGLLTLGGSSATAAFSGRINPRVVSMADATSFTPTGDTADENTHANTQGAGTLTANAPSGTPVDGQRLILRIKSTNVQTFSWNAIYRGSNTVTLPVATTGSSKTDYFGFIYNSADSKWDCVSASYGYT